MVKNSLQPNSKFVAQLLPIPTENENRKQNEYPEYSGGRVLVGCFVIRASM